MSEPLDRDATAAALGDLSRRISVILVPGYIAAGRIADLAAKADQGRPGSGGATSARLWRQAYVRLAGAVAAFAESGAEAVAAETEEPS